MIYNTYELFSSVSFKKEDDEQPGTLFLCTFMLRTKENFNHAIKGCGREGSVGGEDIIPGKGTRPAPIYDIYVSTHH